MAFVVVSGGGDAERLRIAAETVLAEAETQGLDPLAMAILDGAGSGPGGGGSLGDGGGGNGAGKSTTLMTISGVLTPVGRAIPAYSSSSKQWPAVMAREAARSAVPTERRVPGWGAQAAGSTGGCSTKTAPATARNSTPLMGQKKSS